MLSKQAKARIARNKARRSDFGPKDVGRPQVYTGLTDQIERQGGIPHGQLFILSGRGPARSRVFTGDPNTLPVLTDVVELGNGAISTTNPGNRIHGH